jgi:mannonate dehydratase
MLTSSVCAIGASGGAQAAVPARARWQPKLSDNLPDLSPSNLRWLRQLGCEHVVFQTSLKLPTVELKESDQRGYWTAADILPLKRRCEEFGLTLESLMLPPGFYLDARLGGPGRDREIENVCRTVRALAEADVPMLEWRAGPEFYWDDRVGIYTTPGRGGAGLRAFDYERVRNAKPFDEIGIVDESEAWSRLLYFARPVVEAAENAGVRLSLHPCDPPVPVMRGAARLFHHTDRLRRLFQEIPSPANGITFCQGTIAEMGVDVLDEIRHFAGAGRIHLVHLRAVRGTVPQYQEVFMDEGDLDMFEALRTYRDVGYMGLIVSDHTPAIEGDTPWGHRGRAFNIGYVRAMIQALNHLA